MSEDQGVKQPAKLGDDSFGSGLGPDFKPLGKRVLIRPGHDHPKLAMRNSRKPSSKPTARKQQPRQDD